MSRRTAERHPRRIEVRFWRRGHDQPHSGFTVDLSKTGLFLATAIRLDPGERVRLEVVDKERGFMIEGQVARVHRVSLALRHIDQQGVGVRFLGPGDLVSGLVQSAKTKAANEPQPVAPPPAPAKEVVASTPSAPPAALPPELTAAEREAEALFGPDPRAPAPATPAASTAGRAPAPPEMEPAARCIPVEFVDRASFLAVYHRDISAGGLFVTSETPADLHEVVRVELRLPATDIRPQTFEARVVHRFDPKSGAGGPGLAGMGVQFLDPDRVRATLAPIVAGLHR